MSSATKPTADHYGLRLVWLSLVASCLLAGCFNDSPRSGNSDTTATSQSSTVSTSSSAPITPDPSEPIPGSITWNECHGLGIAIDWPNALSLEGGETPPGWEAGPAEADRYQVSLNECQRVSIGRFERGPVRVLVETRRAVSPPAACLDFSPDYGTMKVLISLWVDDPDLANYLATTYHLPVRIGQFSLEVTDQGGNEVQQWTWSNGSNPASQATAAHVGPADPAPSVARHVWHNGTAVSFLDLTYGYSLPDAPVPLAQGTLAPPMRLAERGVSAFTAATSVWKHADLHGPFYRFGDLECKQLLD